MTEIASLLDQSVIEGLKAAAAKAKPEPAEAKVETKAEPEIRIIKASTDPRPPLVPRQRIQTPVQKERTMFDYDNMTDAELGAMVRVQMKSLLAVQIQHARPEVEAERAQRAVAALADVAKNQERQREEHTLAGFTIAGVEIPDLDLTIASTLEEMPSARERSPYNKARYRLKYDEATLDPETTTYAVLAEQHKTLALFAEEQQGYEEAAKTAPKKRKKDKRPGAPRTEAATGPAVVEPEVILAVTEPDEVLKRKAKALAKVMGISKKDAKALILADA